MWGPAENQKVEAISRVMVEVGKRPTARCLVLEMLFYYTRRIGPGTTCAYCENAFEEGESAVRISENYD